jgi:undecaprenyl-diphosphatase
LLGVVEGVTEYLPVSSTGHLLLTTYALQRAGVPFDLEAVESFDIVVQAGAILAVLVHYRALLSTRARGLVEGDPLSKRLFGAIAVAFVPTVVCGLLFRKAIKAHLFGVLPVLIALVVGGVFMIATETYRKVRAIAGEDGLERVSWKRALLVGVGQCFALLPGASRSMCTIVAGQAAGLSTATAAEFSFLLGLPTLGAATFYEGFQSRHVLATSIGAGAMAVGLLVSFVVAWAVIATFLRYLSKRGLAVFGIYRVVFGVAALVAWVNGPG